MRKKYEAGIIDSEVGVDDVIALHGQVGNYDRFINGFPFFHSGFDELLEDALLPSIARLERYSKEVVMQRIKEESNGKAILFAQDDKTLYHTFIRTCYSFSGETESVPHLVRTDYVKSRKTRDELWHYLGDVALHPKKVDPAKIAETIAQHINLQKTFSVIVDQEGDVFEVGRRIVLSDTGLFGLETSRSEISPSKYFLSDLYKNGKLLQIPDFT